MKYWKIILIVLFPGQILFAQVKLPSLFGDNLVLQQQFDAPLWGWAKPGDVVLVSGSWNNNTKEIAAGADGKWIVKLQTPKAGGPYFITINDDTLHNVMIGEVWICSGQSNMQWALSQTDNAEKEIENANYPEIRLFYVARDNAENPQKDCYGKWELCNPETAETFSAVAYYFGKELFNELDVPIGLIHTSWGGSSAQAWTNYQVLQSTYEGRFYIEKYREKIQASAPGILPRDHQSPSGLYNAMLHPLIPYSISGAIWYQGETNAPEHYLYRDLMATMISNWRDEWDQGDFPFYFVQLAPFEYNMPVIGAALRDAQRNTLDVANTGMAVTIDIGDPEDIHPTNKKDVGKRLAVWALNKDYGKDVVFSGPMYSSHEVEGNNIRVFFDYANNGLDSNGETLTHFEMAGKDKQFYPADAIIDGEELVVSSKYVQYPLAVRYAFHNGDEPNLFNKEGLPASTFRTDNWEIFTDKVKIVCEYLENEDTFLINMEGSDRSTEIRYTIDGTVPAQNSKIYTGPFKTNKTGLIKAIACMNDIPSATITEGQVIRHMATGADVVYSNMYNQNYSGGGKKALVNGLLGSEDFYDGNWQGFQGNNLEIIIDLGEKKNINRIKTNCLQVVNSWIVFPEYVEYYVSIDGESFNLIDKIENKIPVTMMETSIQQLMVEFGETETRFVKVIAKNYGKLPYWHPGAGNDAWVFIDEIIVE